MKPEILAELAEIGRHINREELEPAYRRLAALQAAHPELKAADVAAQFTWAQLEELRYWYRQNRSK